eukprot:1095188-Pelagomonas_calceolata.AAC.10
MLGVQLVSGVRRAVCGLESHFGCLAGQPCMMGKCPNAQGRKQQLERAGAKEVQEQEGGWALLPLCITDFNAAGYLGTHLVLACKGSTSPAPICFVIFKVTPYLLLLLMHAYKPPRNG